MKLAKSYDIMRAGSHVLRD